MKSSANKPLRAGDIVEVRSAAEILATLDRDAAVDRMPFMPEMIRHAGRRYKVSSRVDKICDTVAGTGSRRMRDTVFLEDLRCDGAGHGGCQQGCRIYWKEAWLRRVNDLSDPSSGAIAESADAALKLEHLAQARTRKARDVEGEPTEVWRCQATESFAATTPLRTSNLSQYWRELTNGNFSPLRFIFIALRGFPIEIGRHIGLIKPLPLRGGADQSAAVEPVDFRPGDLVQVKSREEIAATLDERGFNRGLSFDREMLRYCGQTMRIRSRVRQIIDDKTGRMLKIRKDCVILEHAYCSGELTQGCWFCPRQIYPFWRNAWLRRVNEPDRGRVAEQPSLALKVRTFDAERSKAVGEGR
jgi:hypothetical protein